MIDTILSPDEARILIRECVTVVRPGETLIIRLPWGTPRDQVGEYRAALDEARERFGLTAVVLVADELGTVPADTDEAFANRVMDAINALDVRATPRNGAGVPVRAEPGSWIGGEAMPAPDFIAKVADDG